MIGLIVVVAVFFGLLAGAMFYFGLFVVLLILRGVTTGLAFLLTLPRHDHPSLP